MVQFLVILVNENSDCTSSMVCKDGIKALLNVKAKTSACESVAIDGGSETRCTVAEADMEATWKRTDTEGATVFVDQTVSSGYVTLDSTIETVQVIDNTSSNRCVTYWAYSANGVTGLSCVAYQASVTRPFLATDPTQDMSIYANPADGYGTTYTFRG